MTLTQQVVDPKGALPDGTKVRLTIEAKVTNWVNGSGYIDGAWFSVVNGDTIEVLEVPEPKFDPLNDDRPIGSRWKDPKTDSDYVRVDVDSESDAYWTYVRVNKGIEDTLGPCLYADHQDDIIKRLVAHK